MGINFNTIYLNILFFQNEAGSVWWGSRSIWSCLEPGPCVCLSERAREREQWINTGKSASDSCSLFVGS